MGFFSLPRNLFFNWRIIGILTNKMNKLCNRISSLNTLNFSKMINRLHKSTLKLKSYVNWELEYSIHEDLQIWIIVFLFSSWMSEFRNFLKLTSYFHNPNTRVIWSLHFEELKFIVSYDSIDQFYIWFSKDYTSNFYENFCLICYWSNDSKFLRNSMIHYSKMCHSHASV